MNENYFSLNRDQSTILKAWAIILVLFHNFFHQLNKTFSENEFDFNASVFPNYVALVQDHPLEIVRSVFSFYGHLGVSVFIVLSAYGLTIQYGGKSVDYVSFMRKRLWRLYPVFFIAILVHALTIAWWRPEPWLDWGIAYLAKLSLLTNFIPGLELKVAGPWWFFSFVVQFYAVFTLIDLIAEKGRQWGLLALAILGWGSIYFVDPLVPIKMKFTVVGWLPEIALGVALAKGYWCRWTAPVMGAALLLFYAGNFTREAWVFQSFCFSVMFVLAAHTIVNISHLSRRLSRFFMLIGALSFPLFAIHGPLRYPFQRLVEIRDSWWFAIEMAIAFFLVAFLFSFIADRLDQQIAAWRSNYQKKDSSPWGSESFAR